LIVSNTVSQLTVTPAWTTTPDATSKYLINGTGMVYLPNDGTWDEISEGVYTTIPLYAVKALSEGPHTVSIHAQDAAGNWGPMGTTTLMVTKTGPSIGGMSVTPNPTSGATSVNLSATATAAQANVKAAEWFIGPDQGAGTGAPIPVATPGSSVNLSASVSVSSLPLGSYQISVRAQDTAGNWGVPGTLLLQKLPADGIFADSFETGNASAWSAASGTNLAVTRAAAMNTGNPAGSLGIFGLQVTVNDNTPGYVTYTDPGTESSYHARFYFNPNGAVTPSGQQDIFVGRDGVGSQIFRIQYHRTTGGVYQLRLGILNTGQPVFSTWFNITNGPHALELAWQSGTTATITVALDGVVQQTRTLDTHLYTLKSVLLGPSGGLVSGMAGTEYFDSFVSTKTTTVGP
jgi:hypothetical protein